MIRIRSNKLLSGVSTLAVMAAFGAAFQPVHAAPLVIPAGPNPPVVVTGNTTSSVTISPGAIVAADGSGNSFTNSGSIFGANTALSINQAILSGGISNTNDMFGNLYGINIFSNSLVGGGISNSGSIAGSNTGIWINNSFVDGSITNSSTGVIAGGTGGLNLSGTTVIDGDITNDGAISGTFGVQLAGSTVLTGGIVNTGAISGSSAIQANGVALLGSSVVADGAITNTGQIQAFFALNANAILINTTGALVGNIDNSGLIGAGSAGSAVGINLQSGVIAGSIINQATGQITASFATTATAVRLSGGTVAGNIDNSGLISGWDGGIVVSGATVAGKILNQSTGVISATTSGGAAIVLSGGNVAQGIDNQGQILANASSGAGILLIGGALQNGITNSGTISATGTGGTAIGMFVGTFSGGIVNTGTIQGDDAGIVVNGATFTGGIANSKTISAASGVAVGVYGTDLGGDFVNDGDGLISATGGAGFSWTGVDFTGSVLNDGAITASNQGIIMLGTGTITGDITNGGDITASSAIAVTAALLDGSVTNTGGLTALTGNGITLNGTITGDVLNDGKITAVANGIFINGVVQGALTNSGGIDPAIGINIDGQVVGGIFNSGDITASLTGIDLSGATAAHTITQSAGSIQSPLIALNLVNGFNDTLKAQGGLISGNINGDGFDAFSLETTGTFAYTNGVANIYHLDVAAAATGDFLIGTDTRGIDGAGATMNVDHVFYFAGAAPRVYLDDNSTINATNGFGPTAGSTTEFFLTTTTATHGLIAAGTVNLNGTLAAYLDPVTFAAAPLLTTTTLTYDDVITGTRTGTFSNGTTLTTSSPFFVGTIVYNAADVDITINRLAFGDVLVAESHNQQAVGTALETIYLAGGYSSDLQDALTALLSAATAAEAQGLLIELSGSQHAQVGQAVQNITGSINSLVRERLDGVLLSEDGVRMSGTPGQRYAQAMAVASDAAGSGLRGSQGMSRGASGWSVWGRAFENEINVDTDADASGYDHDSQGGIVGVDYATSPNTTIGAAAAYATSDVWFDTTPDTADIESWQVNLFASYGFGRFYLDGQGSYAWHDIGTLRSIDLPAPAGSDIATASYNASAWSVNGELGAIWRLGRVNVQPSVAVAYIDSSADSFTESSTAGYALSVDGADGESLSTTLALRASGQWMMAKTPVVPDLKIGWRHEYMDDNSSFSAAFIDDPSVVMSIVSSQVKADSLVISSGATFGVTTNFELFFDVNGQYNADASLTNASGGVRFTW